ncbi:MAG: TIGR02594 family protein [Bacteroidota bacterium]
MILNENLLRNALGYIGLREIPGPDSEPIIIDMVHELFPDWQDDTTIAWCSIFMHQIARNECAENPADLNEPLPGMARSWLNVGEVVDNPMPGDVCILWRGSPNGPKGHVGLYCNTVDRHVHLLGGNQSNAVKVSAYAAHRVLGYRRLRPLQPM